MTADNNQSAQPDNDFNKSPQKLHLAASGAIYTAFEPLVGLLPLRSKAERSTCFTWRSSRCLAVFDHFLLRGFGFIYNHFLLERARGVATRRTKKDSKKKTQKEFKRRVFPLRGGPSKSAQDGRSNKSEVLQASRGVVPLRFITTLQP